jgi:hypothetical protein
VGRGYNSILLSSWRPSSIDDIGDEGLEGRGKGGADTMTVFGFLDGSNLEISGGGGCRSLLPAKQPRDTNDDDD